MEQGSTQPSHQEAHYTSMICATPAVLANTTAGRPGVTVSAEKTRMSYPQIFYSTEKHLGVYLE